MAVDAFMMAVLVIIYLAITLLIGYAGYKKTKTTDDYLVAGRSSHPFIIALSYGATFISTSAIVGFGGQAANLGMGLIWLTVLNIGLGILIAFVFFGKKTREIGQRLSAVTFPDLMCKVYRSPLLQYISGFIIVISMPLYTAAILIGGARFIEPTLGISYTSSLLIFAFITAVYVIFGGLIAVMYTDAFQGAIMFIGMSVLLVLDVHSGRGSDGREHGALEHGGPCPQGARRPGDDRLDIDAAARFTYLVHAGHHDCARRRDRGARPAAAGGPVHDRKGQPVAQPGGVDRRDLYPDDDRCCVHRGSALERLLLPAWRADRHRCCRGECGLDHTGLHQRCDAGYLCRPLYAHAPCRRNVDALLALPRDGYGAYL